jgi:ubiquinone/menaquinone biosynthesis C-methylase UbiE
MKAPPQPTALLTENLGIDAWESAYLRFETPEQEIAKFQKRLRHLGIDRVSRDAQFVELFCGRGNGLHALSRWGFSHVEGIDLSPRLIGCYHGPAKCLVGDCRQLPFPDQSRDVLIVQGGLHHLPTLPESLEQTFREMRRVLRKDGRFVAVEPWLTPFLKVVHCVSEIYLVRRMSNKLDALATMIEHERQTYEQWLDQPALVLKLARSYFSPVHEEFAWGKWQFVGKPL